MFSRQTRMTACLAVAVLLALAGCGKRGNPQPPLQFNPAQTLDLEIRQLGGEVLLSFSYPLTTMSGLTLAGINGVEIYQAEIPLTSAEELAESEAQFVGPPAPPPFSDLLPDSPFLPEDDVDILLGAQPSPGPPDLEVEDEVGIEADIEAARQAELEAIVAQLPPIEPETDEEPVTADADTDTDTDIPVVDPALVEPLAPSGPALPRIDPSLFNDIALLALAIDERELVSSTTGTRVRLRLRLGEVSEESEPALLAFGVRTNGIDGLQSPLSNIVTLLPKETPAAPTALALMADRDWIELSWTWEEIELPESFRIYRRNVEELQFPAPLATVTPDARSYLDPTAVYGTGYFYAVRAVSSEDETVESPISSEEQIDYRDVFPPPAPLNLEVLPEAGQARVLWDASFDDDRAGYLVYRREADSEEFRRVNDEPVTRQELIDGSLTPGLVYEYRVTSVDRNGNESEPGNTFSIRAR